MRLVLFLTILFTITLPAFSIPNHVLDGSFSSRSGQIQLGFPSDELFTQNRLPSATLFLSNPLSEKPTLTSLEETQVSDLLAHSLGVSPLFCDVPFDRTQYPKDSIFSKPAAAFVLAVDAASSDLLSFGQLPSLPVLPATLSRSSLATLETLFSGATPSDSGIVADSWPSGKSSSTAGSADGKPLVPSFADWIANTEPRSLVVSAAQDSRFASVMGTRSPHPNAKTVASPQVSAQALVQFFPESFGFSLEQDVLRVSLPSVRANFQLSQPADLAFLTELQALVSLVDSFAVASPVSQDAYPDLYTVAFASTSAFLPASAKHRAALQLVEAAFAAAVERFSAAYAGRLLAAAVQLHPALPAQVDAACAALAQHEWVSEVTTLPVDQSCPDLYVSQSLSAAQIASLSQQVVELTASQGVSSYVIPQRIAIPIFSHSALRADNTTSPNSYTSDQVAMFQITLWTSILLFLVLVAVLSGLFCLTWEGYDSQVFIESNTVQRNMIIGYKE